MTFHYDVIVVGAGHAGCEAASSAARLGARTCLITMDLDKIAQMSCNPAVGGIAKGQIVREVDALGGQMGLMTDRAAVQLRMLNCSKGPAVWSPRAQCDRNLFSTLWRHELENINNLFLWQDQVTELLVGNQHEVLGVRTQWGAEFRAPTVVITAGTFLHGLMHMGRVQVEGGRIAEPAAKGLTESITQHGIRSGRMKTGTPVRIDRRTVNFSKMERQDGDVREFWFSFHNEQPHFLHRPSQPCWICYTNEDVHEILRSGFADSPLYNGQIQSIGPRYCPSIETKLHVFPERDQHLLFLEPEGSDTNEMYLNGFSSSLPMDVQINALRKIPGLENVEIYRPGYAIEYDYFDPTQLRHTLESKVVNGLFFAGQVNGTTGYEEAAGQGLVAGINAALYAGGQHHGFTLRRDQAYIGVLIDDLVTKGVDEPYRMFTSRAEYRILLRQDDADMRLTPLGHQLGLLFPRQYEWLQEKSRRIEHLITFTQNFSAKATILNPALEKLHTTPLQHGCKLNELLVRPQLTFKNLAPHISALHEKLVEIGAGISQTRSHEIIEAAEIRIKYEGYIRREREAAEKMQRLEDIPIDGHFDYAHLTAISIEARQKLQAIQPVTLAQASRIPGVSPSDINALLVLLHH